MDPLPERISKLERPDPALWKYYLIRAILTGPGILGTLPYLYFRYHTLRYRFDEEGIHMKVGLLFRREINLTYARIQDIHLRSGFVQRWLGLANVEVQTASGSRGAELVIEGFKEYEAIRDFLYTRMRGYQGQQQASGVGIDVEQARATASIGPATGAAANSNAELVSLLLGIRDELRQTRELLAGSEKPPAQPPQLPPNV